MEDERQAICRIELPTLDEVEIVRRRFRGAAGPHVALVAGIRGDTPEGVRVLYEITRILRQASELVGTVDIFPCANPLAAHAGMQRWPFFDVDLGGRFPGRKDGHPPDRVAHALTQRIQAADVVLELRGAKRAFRELAQAQVPLGQERARELASHANVELVWERSPGPGAAVSFPQQFESVIVLKGGAGNRLTENVGGDLCAGVMNLLTWLGMTDEQLVPVHWAAIQRATHVQDAQVHELRTSCGGMFLPKLPLGAEVQPGDELGLVADPLEARELESLRASRAGRVVAIREQPQVFPGSLVARLVSGPGEHQGKVMSRD